MVYCQLTFRPALFLRSSLARLVDQEIIELFPLDRCDEPTGSSAATCPSLARWTTIFECDFSPSHRAYTCPTQAIRFVANRFRSFGFELLPRRKNRSTATLALSFRPPG